MKHCINVDVAIIGSGPAGLAAGSALSDSGLKYLIIERGQPLDKRDLAPDTLIHGAGGAGLFSDGKFSFYPSASHLWMLDDRSGLMDSYEWLVKLLSKYGVEAPNFPVCAETWKSCGGKGIKEYPSIRMENINRHKMISSLVASQDENIMFSADVFKITPTENRGYEIKINRNYEIDTLRCRFIIFAGGRFGSLVLKKIMPYLPFRFLRYEIGLRLEQLTENWVFNQYVQPDIKVIEPGPRQTEWRTFCTCRSGKVLKTRWHYLDTYSGTCDNGESFYSNIALLLRFNSVPELPLLQEIESILSGDTRPLTISLAEYMREHKVLLGKGIDDLFIQKLESLPFSDLPNVRIYSPCIEGLGHYPAINNNLKVESANIFIAGDSTGIFRGLTAAMVSGFYVGLQIKKHFTQLPRNSTLFIKSSPAEMMPIIFTAQSKEFFYARDVICQFVLKQNKVPINPFRVFGYFLNDMVDRNIIRQSNNQLVASADELWVFGMVSDGVLFEIYRAKMLYKPVRFFTVASKVSEIREIAAEEVKFDPEVHARGNTRAELMDILKNFEPVDIYPYQLSLFKNGKK